MGYERDTTPFLDDLAADAYVANQCYANGTASAQAFRSILSSTYPLEHDDYDSLSPRRPYLPKILSDAGVETYGFNAENPYISHYFDFDRGFDHFEDFMNWGAEAGTSTTAKSALRQWAPRVFEVGKQVYFSPLVQAMTHAFGEQDKPYRPAGDVVDAVVATVESVERGTFLWVHFMDVHSPYLPYREYEGEFVDTRPSLGTVATSRAAEQSNVPALRDCYDEAIRYVDSQLRRLTVYLDEVMGDYHLLVTNDHGELFGEHDTLGHPHEHLYPEQVRAPLVVRSPDKDVPAENADALQTHLDITPTVLDIYDIKIPQTSRGQSLFEPIEREHVIGETCPYDPEAYAVQYDQNKVAMITDDRFYVDTYDTDAESIPNTEPREHVYDDATTEPNERAQELIEEHRNTVHFAQSMDDIFSRRNA